MPRQSRNKAPRKSRRAPKQPKASNSRLVEFPEAQGRTVEKVALCTDSDFPCISIRFQDKTDLTVVIDPWLTFKADYSRWKDGNQKVLKRWPVFRSDGM
ncbi:MAG TPA: hypothetical protein VGR76_00395 [Candidatus Angelobacter sp.]|nr:hypothetical protein [Candidatus Angelobacter sp.]